MEPFITSDGREIPLKGIGSWYVQKILDKYQLPRVPTYEVVIGIPPDQETQVFEHNETTVETPEEKAVWAAYKAERDRILAERQEALIKFLSYNCIALDPPPPEEWRFDFDLFGIEPPDPADKVEYKFVWLENDLLPDLENDWSRLIPRLFEIGGILEEGKTQEYERFFRAILAWLAAGGSLGASTEGFTGEGADGRDIGLGEGTDRVGT